MLCWVLAASQGICIVMHGLLPSCGPGALQPMGSVVMAHRLSCPMACGILVPQSEFEPESPALEERFLTTGPPRKSCFKKTKIFFFFLRSSCAKENLGSGSRRGENGFKAGSRCPPQNSTDV